MILGPASQLGLGLAFAIALMAALWVIQCLTRDAGIVDVGWSSSLGILAIFYGLTLDGATPRTLLVVLIASIWSLRLAIYLLRDRIIGKPEDGRYQKLRVDSGSRAWLFFLGFFELQALLAWIFSLPFWIAMRREDAIGPLDVAGLAIWLVAILGESFADAQLAQFRSDPANQGKTCRRGLWHYTRHPNYFFEWLHWWSYFMIALPSAWGWTTVFAPMLMLFFLFKVTGIPATEARALVTRGDDYREYQRTTSAFIPWFPKNETVIRTGNDVD